MIRVEARADILRIHSRSMNLTRGINLTKIAGKMNGCSGAELKGVCTEAGMFALRERRVHVTQEDFDLATAKILNKHDDKVSDRITVGVCLALDWILTKGIGNGAWQALEVGATGGGGSGQWCTTTCNTTPSSTEYDNMGLGLRLAGG